MHVGSALLHVPPTQLIILGDEAVYPVSQSNRMADPSVAPLPANIVATPLAGSGRAPQSRKYGAYM